MSDRLPISQDFHSIQGEGYHVGVPMHFIRLSGCNVGVFPNPAKPPKEIDNKLLVIQRDIPNHSICTSYVGEQFICDTDYNKVIGKLSVEDIVKDTWEQHICFTGGEPLLFAKQLEVIIKELVEQDFQINIETSGTLVIPKAISDLAWVTCSPKHQFKGVNVHHIDELKFLISVDTTGEDIEKMEELSEMVGQVRGGYTYIQPVNWIEEVSNKNVERCMTLLRSHPEWRLSVQLHKLLNVD